eukprot:275781_1
MSDENVQFDLIGTGIIIGSMHKFVDANFTLQFRSNTTTHSNSQLTLMYEFLAEEMIKNEYQLEKVKDSQQNALRIKDEERSFKCWIPYEHKEYNIESIHQFGRSIWKTNKLPG